MPVPLYNRPLRERDRGWAKEGRTELLKLHDTETPLWLRACRAIRSLIVFAGAASVVIEFGFFLHQAAVLCLTVLQIVAVVLVVAHAVIGVARSPEKRLALGLRAGRLLVALIAVVVWLCAAFGIEGAFIPGAIAMLKFSAIFFALVHTLPEPGDAIRLPLPAWGLKLLYGNPTLMVVLSFVFVILVGTMLLCLPRATPARGIAVVDALFTATSATCVTGLIVKDTPNDFTRFGHWVIVGLIQVGGLGIMTITAFFAAATCRRMRMSQTQIMQTSLDTESFADVHQAVRAIIVLTFTIEAVGAMLLFTQWSEERSGIGTPLFCSMFHSVSAFCNAGFALFSDNLMEYRVNIPINLTITSLIVLGGLGFTVLVDIYRVLKLRSTGRRSRLELHSRLVLTTTLVLIVSGTLLFFVMEHTHVLRGLPFKDKILSSYFQSVTTRTAGFNTVDISAMNPATLFGFMVLMFIGGSPGSTAGGIKTTTAALVFLALIAAVRGRRRINCAGFTVPTEVMWRALAIMAIALFAFSIVFMLLLLPVSMVDGGTQTSFRDIMFEAFSAFGTVGLSAGVTPHLSTVGKLLICALMFMGRLGPLSLAIALSGRPSPDLVRYPEANVMVG